MVSIDWVSAYVCMHGAPVLAHSCCPLFLGRKFNSIQPEPRPGLPRSTCRLVTMDHQTHQTQTTTQSFLRCGRAESLCAVKKDVNKKDLFPCLCFVQGAIPWPLHSPSKVPMPLVPPLVRLATRSWSCRHFPCMLKSTVCSLASYLWLCLHLWKFDSYH